MTAASFNPGLSIKAVPHLTFKMCLDAGAAAHTERIVVIAEAAAREYAVESAIETIEKEWEEITMDVQPYKNTGERAVRAQPFEGPLEQRVAHVLIHFKKEREEARMFTSTNAWFCTQNNTHASATTPFDGPAWVQRASG